MRKPWSRRLAAAFAAVAVLAAAGAALACACLPGDAADQLEAVDVAFIGKAESIRPYRGLDGSPLTIARFRVRETLAGPHKPWREVGYWDAGGSCGSRYAVGQTYAVLANRTYEGRLWTVHCVEREQTPDDYIKAVRPPPRGHCIALSPPSKPDPEYIGPGVVWRRCPGYGGRPEDLALRTTRTGDLCRVQALNRGLDLWFGQDFLAVSAGPCPALDKEGSTYARPPYVAVTSALSNREFRRLHRWAARNGGGELRQIEVHSALFGFWRSYALWIDRPGADVHLRREGLFGGWLL